jgi:phage shock protein PspC (stress-responsive transcriptional regulator)
VNDRLYRSRQDRVIGGVCAGVADRLDLDPSLVRVGWALLTIVTGGAFLLLYVVMLVIVPEEPLAGIPPAPPAPGPGAVPGWQPPGAEGQAGWPAAGTAVAAGTAASAGTEAAAGTEQPAGWQAPTSDASQPAGWQAPPGTVASEGGPVPAWTPPDQAYAARRAARVERHRRNEGLIGLAFGVLLILAGVWFLLREYLPDIDFDAFWPIAIIALGLLFVVLAFRPGRGSDAS